MKVLVCIDLQNDFIDGVLGSKEAQAIIPKVKEKVATARKNGDRIIFTRDTHLNKEEYLSSSEGKYLPIPHCIYNTKGWEIEKTLNASGYFDNEMIIDKKTFGEVNLPGYVLFISKDKVDEIEFIGLDTDICVISNALICQAYFRKYYPNRFIKLSVDATCCAGSSVEAHEAALKVMKSCQIEIKGEE